MTEQNKGGLKPEIVSQTIMRLEAGRLEYLRILHGSFYHSVATSCRVALSDGNASPDRSAGPDGCAAPCLSFNRSCSWGPKAPGLLILCVLLMQSRETRVQKPVYLQRIKTCQISHFYKLSYYKKHAGYHTFINYFCSSVPVSVCCSAERG